eukprot:394111_1
MSIKIANDDTQNELINTPKYVHYDQTVEQKTPNILSVFTETPDEDDIANLKMGSNMVVGNDVLSLFQFSKNDIANKIRDWVENDVNYKKYLNQSQKIFKHFKLSG